MKEHIITVINQIEKEYGVKILYACDAGSRALGFAAKGSDYDIRFIYIHKHDWYLSIDQHRDVIEIPKEDSLSIMVDSRLDIVGWELTKTLRLFRKSNPSLLEWLKSKQVYREKGCLVEKLKFMQDTVFSQKPYINHHMNLAKRNITVIEKNGEFSAKLYLYILRSILSAKWVQIYQQIPPIEFEELLSILDSILVSNEVTKLLSMKQSGEQYFTGENKVLKKFIKQELELLDSYAKSVSQNVDDPTENLNELFRATLMSAWR